MCLSTVYRMHDGEKQLVCKNVAAVRQQEGALVFTDIMGVQTRVEAVKGYYSRFLEALPTVQALAACDDDTLHKLWEGLGYYSRVRNLQKAAKIVCCLLYTSPSPRDA